MAGVVVLVLATATAALWTVSQFIVLRLAVQISAVPLDPDDWPSSQGTYFPARYYYCEEGNLHIDLGIITDGTPTFAYFALPNRVGNMGLNWFNLPKAGRPLDIPLWSVFALLIGIGSVFMQFDAYRHWIRTGMRPQHFARNFPPGWLRTVAAAIVFLGTYCIAPLLIALAAILLRRVGVLTEAVASGTERNLWIGFALMGLSFVMAFLLAYSVNDWLKFRIEPVDLAGCYQCGYNLTGNTSGVCPECGRPLTARQLAAAGINESKA